MKNENLMRQGIPDKRIIHSEADMQHQIANARKVGRIETVNTLIRVGKTGLLAFGAYVLTTKFTSNKLIAIVAAAVIGGMDFFRIDASISGLKNIIGQGKDIVNSSIKNIEEIGEQITESENKAE